MKLATARRAAYHRRMLPIERCSSPNHGERRCGPTDILLLHYTAMPSCEGAVRWLCNPDSSVSCHYVVFESGRIVQLVDEISRAWHAGLSAWAGETDINSRSVGIEICHPGDEGDVPPYPPAQVAALVWLCRGILARHPIPPERVLGHSDVAPARKRDPGAWFPWERLAEAGVGLWVEPEPVGTDEPWRPDLQDADVRALQDDLAGYGYDCPATGIYDEHTALMVSAFQRHFRPARVDGLADLSTRRTLARLLAARTERLVASR